MKTLATKNDKVFRPGERVRWLETGKTGKVLRQFKDGYVVLEFNGWPAELDAESIEKIKIRRKLRRTA